MTYQEYRDKYLERVEFEDPVFSDQLLEVEWGFEEYMYKELTAIQSEYIKLGKRMKKIQDIANGTN